MVDEVTCDVSLPNAEMDWALVVERAGELFERDILRALPASKPWSRPECSYEADAVGFHTERVDGTSHFALSLTTTARADGSPPPRITWKLAAQVWTSAKTADPLRNTVFRGVMLGTGVVAAAIAWLVLQPRDSVHWLLVAVLGLFPGAFPAGMVLGVLAARSRGRRSAVPGGAAFLAHVKELAKALR